MPKPLPPGQDPTPMINNLKKTVRVADKVQIYVSGRPDGKAEEDELYAAFAMGRGGINFIENKKSLEGYMIDENKISTLTTGLGKYEVN